MSAVVFDMDTYRESDESYVYRKVMYALRGTHLRLVAEAQVEGARRLTWGRTRQEAIDGAVAWALRQKEPPPTAA